MLTDGVKCSKLTHLKHFTLNAAKNFINSFPKYYYSQLKLGGAKVTLGGALFLLALPRIFHGYKNSSLVVSADY